MTDTIAIVTIRMFYLRILLVDIQTTRGNISIVTVTYLIELSVSGFLRLIKSEFQSIYRTELQFGLETFG